MTDERLDLPPHSVETEENLLGSILMNPEALHEVASFLTAEDFYIVRHGWIWDIFLRLNERSDPIDNRTVAEELRVQEDPTGKHANKLVAVGGEAYLNYLPSNVPTALHAEIYGRIVERAAIRRRLLGTAGDISQLAYDEDLDINKIMDQAEQLLFQVTGPSRSVLYTPFSGSEGVGAVASFMTTLEARRNGDLSAVGIPTGFIDFDKEFDGFAPGELTIVASRPGMGKTAWCTTVSRAIAGKKRSEEKPYHILHHSSEMNEDSMLSRYVAAETGVTMRQLRSGDINDKQWSAVVKGLGRLSEMNIYLSDTPNVSPPALASAARRLHHENRLDMVIVDYISPQKMDCSGAGRGANAVNQMAYLVGAMQHLAQELNIPVLAAAQVKRAVEDRTSKVPQLGDISDSSEAEKTAANIIFLYRDEVYNPDDTDRPNECDVIIAKQRNGPAPRTETLLFLKERTSFASLRRVRTTDQEPAPMSAWKDS